MATSVPAKAVTARWGWLTIRVPGVGWSFRILLRPVAVTLVAAALALVALVWSLSIGRPQITPSEVVQLLAGGGDPTLRPVLFRFRLARGLGGVYAGAALGIAGAILQRLARNPLATPELIGVTGGATTAAVFGLIVLGWTGAGITLAALVGGFAAALFVYSMAFHRGTMSGYRLVLVGVGMTFLFGAVTAYLVSQTTLDRAQRTVTYLIGSLADTNWRETDSMRDVIVVVLPIALLLARSLRTLEMGDDVAVALGTRREAARAGLLACGVALAAVAAAACGPVAFVALLAAQIARSLAGGRTATLLPAAAIGAFLVVTADLIAREVVPEELPVGVVTAAIGAPFLLLLLARTNRIGELG